MKFIDKIIADIPKLDIEREDSEYHDEIKYVVDTRVLLDNLREYEVEIPSEYIEKYEQVFGNGVLQYMENLTSMKAEEFNGGNTYNWNGRILHDIDYRYIQADEDTFYVAIQVHRIGDIRYNYTQFALFKFDSFENFYETLDDICMENFGGCYTYNDKHYTYDITIFSEMMSVWCEETQDEYEIYAYDDESFEKEIQKVA